MLSKLKIAFIGVSHWHVPLYLPAVYKNNLNVVAVSDPNYEIAMSYAVNLNCKAYDDYFQLLDLEQPDFVFAFEIHAQMPVLAKELIRRGIPFTIEKPVGLKKDEVEELLNAAQKNNVFCAVPFIWRYSPLLKQMKEQVRAEDYVHFSFKFIAGPPSRYLKTSPWMLEASKAGGGCMTNLGVHFIDMAMYLSGARIGKVLGSVFHYSNDYDVEDYAVSLISLEGGSSIHLETGYAYPMNEKSKRENRWNFVTRNGYYTLGEGYFETRNSNGVVQLNVMDTDSDSYYADFVEVTLKEYISGKKPTAGLADMLCVRQILDDIVRFKTKNMSSC